MKRFFFILTLILLALLAGAGLWFAAWLFHWSPWLGLLGPLVFLVIPGLYILVSRTIAWREKRRYEKSVLRRDKAVAGPGEDERDEMLKNRWEEGLGEIRRLAPGGARSSLPWFLIMGASGSGKSSLLAASGLVNNPVREAGDFDSVDFRPKSGYDWVFFDKGVILDVGGVFCEAPSEEGLGRDQKKLSDAWDSMVSLLSATRGRRGISGVLVTVSADRLRPGGEEKLHDHACRLRNRLAKLTWALDRGLPVVVAVTKTDLLPGLGRVLDSLDRQGVLAGREADPSVLFGGALAKEAVATLSQASSECLLDNLENPGAMAELLSASSSAQSMEGPLTIFLDALGRFVGTVPPPRVTGLYFCRVEGLGRTENKSQIRVTVGSPAKRGGEARSDKEALLGPLAEKNADYPQIEPFARTRLDSGGFSGGNLDGVSGGGPAGLSGLIERGFEGGLPALRLDGNLAQADYPALDLLDALPAPVRGGAANEEPAAANLGLDSRGPAGSFKGRAIRELLSEVLPRAAREAAPLRLPGTARERRLGYAVAVYLGILLFISFLCWVNVGRNKAVSEVARSAAVSSPSRSNMGELDRAYGQSRLLDRLTLVAGKGFLPSIGPDRGAEAAKRATSEFLSEFENVEDDLIGGLEAQMRASGDRQTENFTLSLRQLLWLTSVLREYLDDDTAGLDALFDSFPALPPDFEGPSRPYWNLVFSELLLDYLRRKPDREKVMGDLNRLELIIARGAPMEGDRSLSWLAGWVDRLPESRPASLANGLDGTLLSRLSRLGDLAEMDASYTARGRGVVLEALSQLRSIYNHPEVFESRAESFERDYDREYLALWREFARKSVSIGGKLETPAELAALISNALSLMNENLEPFMGKEDTPAWILNLELEVAQTLVHREIARKSRSEIGGLSGLMETASNLGDDLSGLRRLLKPPHYQDAELLGRVMGGSQPYKDYHDLLSTIAAAIFNKPEDAMVIASTHFGGSAFGNPEESPFALAERALARYLTFHYRDDDNIADDPVSDMVSIQLHSLRRLLVRRAAETLERYWESEVLAQVRFMGEEEARRRLFGSGGLIDAFLAQRAAPFLASRGDIEVAAEWESIRFPFAPDFLSLVAVGRNSMSQAGTMEDAYDVSIQMQGVSVNAEAKEKPQSVSLTLKSPESAQRLENLNYPSSRVFKYEPGKSGDLILEIIFPSLTLTVAYEGHDGFPFFLRDAVSGEYELTPEDFPDQADRLKASGIEKVSVRLSIEGAPSVLRFVEFAEAPPLPGKITDPGLI